MPGQASADSCKKVHTLLKELCRTAALATVGEATIGVTTMIDGVATRHIWVLQATGRGSKAHSDLAKDAPRRDDRDRPDRHGDTTAESACVCLRCLADLLRSLSRIRAPPPQRGRDDRRAERGSAFARTRFIYSFRFEFERVWSSCKDSPEARKHTGRELRSEPPK